MFLKSPLSCGAGLGTFATPRSAFTQALPTVKQWSARYKRETSFLGSLHGTVRNLSSAESSETVDIRGT